MSVLAIGGVGMLASFPKYTEPIILGLIPKILLRSFVYEISTLYKKYILILKETTLVNS